jgi:hypothetical protein
MKETKRTAKNPRRSIAAYIAQGFCLGVDPALVDRYHHYCRRQKVPFICVSGHGNSRRLTVTAGGCGVTPQQWETIRATIAGEDGRITPRKAKEGVTARIPADQALDVVSKIVGILQIPAISASKVNTRAPSEEEALTRFASIVDYNLMSLGDIPEIRLGVV